MHTTAGTNFVHPHENLCSVITGKSYVSKKAYNLNEGEIVLWRKELFRPEDLIVGDIFRVGVEKKII